MRQSEIPSQDQLLTPAGLPYRLSGPAPTLVPQSATAAPAVVRTLTMAAALLAVALLTGCNGRTILTDDIESPPKPMFSETRVFFVHERHGSLELLPVVRKVHTNT
ncbi:MAG: hypothetical protein ACRD3W_22420, partial [Terriglobales bacterium]